MNNLNRKEYLQYLDETIELRIKWWSDKRGQYNLGLILSGLLAFILYAIVVEFIVPSDIDIEITIFTMLFQGIGYLVMMVIANLFFNLGALSERIIKPKNIDLYRNRAFILGFWFSCGLPFLLPLYLVILYW